MKIVTNENECYAIIENYKNSILDSTGYKKILNSHYNPDAYLFFVDGEDVIPLVVKNNLVTFYGHPSFNVTDSLRSNKTLLNEILFYLKEEDYDFHLLSIYNDYFDLLEDKNKQYDVPYPVEWHYKDIQHFDKLNILNGVTGKRRVRYKRMLKECQNYTSATISFAEFKNQFDFFIKAHIDYFLERGIESVWKNNENFLLEQLEYFENEENLIIRTISLKQNIIAFYTLVYNNEEIIALFGTALTKEDSYISKAIYLDTLETGKQIASGTKITQLNGSRGTAVNKKIFGFIPVPLYALVKDDNWVVQRDSSIDPESYESVYGRNSWGQAE